MKQANPALIGGFIVSAVVLAVAGVLLFSSGKLLTDTFRAVMYFEGAVQGLQVGAPVNFRGVKVGSVVDIKTTLDRQTFDIRIPVIVEFPRGAQGRIEMANEVPPAPQEILVSLVQRGLRAQLQTESLVTGLLFIQLDITADDFERQARTDPVTGLLEIPTVPTTLQEVTQAARQAITKLGDLPLEQAALDLVETLRSIRSLVSMPELQEAIRQLNATLVDTQTLVQHLDRDTGRILATATTALGGLGKLTQDLGEASTEAQQLMQRLGKDVGRVAASATTALGSAGKLAQHADSEVLSLGSSLTETARTARSSLDHVQETLSAFQKVLAPNAPVGYELLRTLRELADAARSFRVLADYLERHPNAVVFGRNDGRGR